MTLPPELGELIGATWATRMEMEHLAVSQFARFTGELAELGCQPAVLELCARAVADEVRHAAQCRDVARRWLGDARVPAFYRGAAAVHAWPDADRATALALDIVEACCVGETLTVAYFTRMLELAEEPARSVVRALLADEVDHGRLGWAYLGELRGRGFERIAAALPEILARQTADVLAGESGGSDDPRLPPFGYLGPREAAEVYRAGLCEVVLPGFEALGIETKASRARLGLI